MAAGRARRASRRGGRPIRANRTPASSGRALDELWASCGQVPGSRRAALAWGRRRGRRTVVNEPRGAVYLGRRAGGGVHLGRPLALSLVAASVWLWCEQCRNERRCNKRRLHCGIALSADRVQNACRTRSLRAVHTARSARSQRALRGSRARTARVCGQTEAAQRPSEDWASLAPSERASRRIRAANGPRWRRPSGGHLGKWPPPAANGRARQVLLGAAAGRGPAASWRPASGRPSRCAVGHVPPLWACGPCKSAA